VNSICFNPILIYIGKGNLLTADANYAHFRILKAISLRESEFCIRMNQTSDFIKNFLVSGETDIVLEWHPSPGTIRNCKKYNIDSKTLKVRLVRVNLPDNETEALALSLLDQRTYSYECIRNLYDSRWSVEEEIKKFMKRLIVDFFID